jgi:hypothetical protein
MVGLLVALLALALAFFALLDGWYLVRVPCAVLRARLLQPRVRDLLAEQSYSGRVLPSDLDLLLHMNNARYLLEPFEVRTRLLGWDDRAFYLEARFVSLRDGFLCALLRSRQHVVGTSPDRVVQHLCKRRVSSPGPRARPPPPPAAGVPSGLPALGRSPASASLGCPV